MDSIDWLCLSSDLKQPQNNSRALASGAKSTFYCNVRRRLVTWDEPEDVAVRRGGRVFWELFDQRSQRAYFLDAQARRTRWTRPTDSEAVIVPLTALAAVARPQRLSVDAQTQTDGRRTSRGTQTQDELRLRDFLVSEARFAGLELSDDSESCEYSADADDESEEKASSEEIESDEETFERIKAVETRPKDVVDGRAEVEQRPKQTPEAGEVQTQPNKQLARDVRTSSMPTTTFKVRHANELLPHAARASRLLNEEDSSTIPSKASEERDELEDFAREHMTRTRKGVAGLLQKKQSLKLLLRWTKHGISEPMILSIPQQQRRECVTLFRLVRLFMGDLRSSQSQDEVALQAVTSACKTVCLRDELLVQLAKQTTNHPKPNSTALGLELLCVCLFFFRPSNKLQTHLQNHLKQQRHANAALAVRLLQKKCSVHHARAPDNTQVIVKVRACVRRQHPGVFGEPLPQQVPWPVTWLAERVLQAPSESLEGVFRLAGDVDAVQALRLQMDVCLSPEELPQDLDVHVYCSALKLFVRDLPEPLVSVELENEALNSCTDHEAVRQLVVRLPQNSRSTLTFIVKLLQKLASDISVSRMDTANLATVWAPNLFGGSLEERVPSASTPQDAGLILERTRRQMNFTKTLLHAL